MVDSILVELALRKSEIKESVETIYFGGGTPSLLDLNDLNRIFEQIYKHYSVSENPEVTLEANPDDLSIQKIKDFKTTPINRFSIGTQSFFDEDLKLMNRAHATKDAIESIQNVQEAGFDNITIDLIYGGPTTDDERWQLNLNQALDLQVPHISAYALTIEPKTILHHQIKTGKVVPIDEERQERQFQQMVNTLTHHHFIHYEISNFGKEGYLSRHNSNYWKGVPYLGIGPAAHSYDGQNRSWNLANNSIYIKKLKQNELACEIENLSLEDRFNEQIMIRLRTIYGLDLKELENSYPKAFLEEFYSELQIHLDQKLVEIKNHHLYITPKGKFLADGIAASLFRITDN